MQPLGEKIRKRRQRQALSLDDLAALSGISKPYLSLIENGKVINPPSDEKLRTLETILKFQSGELLTQAHLIRTPDDIRAMLACLARQNETSRSATTHDTTTSTNNIPPKTILNKNGAAVGRAVHHNFTTQTQPTDPASPRDTIDTPLTTEFARQIPSPHNDHSPTRRSSENPETSTHTSSTSQSGHQANHRDRRNKNHNPHIPGKNHHPANADVKENSEVKNPTHANVCVAQTSASHAMRPGEKHPKHLRPDQSTHSTTPGSRENDANRPREKKIRTDSLITDDRRMLKPIDLDQAYLTGLLHQLAEQAGGNVERVRLNAVPIINRVSAGYPKDFTDLSYPRGVADDYVGCPEVADTDAFAARVHGDSMCPKYTQGDIVIFSPAANCRNGDDCFVRFEDGQTTFKRVFFEKSETDEPIIRLQPRNEKYRPQIVRPDQITGIYRAMYRYQSIEGG